MSYSPKVRHKKKGFFRYYACVIFFIWYTYHLLHLKASFTVHLSMYCERSLFYFIWIQGNTLLPLLSLLENFSEKLIRSEYLYFKIF